MTSFAISLLLMSITSLEPEISIRSVEHWKMPNPQLASTSMIVVDGVIYSFGGHLGNQHEYAPENFTNESWALDTNKEDSSWQALPAKPFAVLGQGIAEWNGDIYLFGGFGVDAQKYAEYIERRKAGDRNARSSMAWLSSNKTEKFNIAEKKWEVLDTEFPIRSSFGFAQFGPKVYIFNGWNSATNEFYETVGILDLSTQTYEETEIETPFIPRRAFSAYAWGEDKVILAGGLIPAPGKHPEVDVTNEVWVFRINDPINPWKEMVPMPFATTIPNLAIFGDRFYLLGGYMGDIGNRGLHRDDSPMNTDQIYSYQVGDYEYSVLEGFHTSEPLSFRRMLQLSETEWAAIGGYQHVEGVQDGIMKSRPGQVAASTFEIISIKKDF